MTKEEAIELVKQEYNALQYLDSHFKSDKDVVLTATYQNGNALQYASNGLKNDREIVFAAVRKSGYSLKYASDECKNDKEFIKRILAVNNASILDDIDGLWKDDANILSCINTTFNITTDLKTGQQIWESKAHKLRRHTSINNLTLDNFYNQMKAVA